MSGDSFGAMLAGVGLFFAAIIPYVGDIAAVVSITAGVSSFLINYPKLKERVKSIYNTIFQRKT